MTHTDLTARQALQDLEKASYELGVINYSMPDCSEYRRQSVIDKRIAARNIVLTALQTPVAPDTDEILSAHHAGIKVGYEKAKAETVAPSTGCMCDYVPEGYGRCKPDCKDVVPDSEAISDWVTVPRRATDCMLDRGDDVMADAMDLSDVYTAMVDVAPQRPTPQPADADVSKIEYDRCPDCGHDTLYPSGTYCNECNPLGDDHE